MVAVKAVSFPDTNLSFHSLSIPGERTVNGSSAQASVAWSWEGSLRPRHLLCPAWLLPRADVCRALKLHLGRSSQHVLCLCWPLCHVLRNQIRCPPLSCSFNVLPACLSNLQWTLIRETSRQSATPVDLLGRHYPRTERLVGGSISVVTSSAMCPLFLVVASSYPCG